MKTKISILLIIFYLCSCEQTHNEKLTNNLGSLPKDLVIRSKTIALDSILSKNLVKCIEYPEQFNTLMSCIISNKLKKFVKEYSLVFDKSKEIDRLYTYLPEGPDVISADELFSDSSLMRHYSISRINIITIDRNNMVVVDNNDTIPIIDYWDREKFIFTPADTLKYGGGRICIYGYE